jgi:hypothetical protein
MPPKKNILPHFNDIAVSLIQLRKQIKCYSTTGKRRPELHLSPSHLLHHGRGVSPLFWGPISHPMPVIGVWMGVAGLLGGTPDTFFWVFVSAPSLVPLTPS